MNDVLLIWETLNDSTSVFHLLCSDSKLEEYKKLHGTFGKLYRQGQPELCEPDLEALRVLLEGTKPVTKDFDAEPYRFRIVGGFNVAFVIICGYNPRDFEIGADYNAVESKLEIEGDRLYDQHVEENLPGTRDHGN